MMISVMSVFILLSLFTLLGSQARMLPGDDGIFKVSSINYKNGRPARGSTPAPKTAPSTGNWIIASSSTTYYGKPGESPPPPPYTEPSPGQRTATSYGKAAKPSPPPPHTSPSKDWITVSPTTTSSSKSPPPRDDWITSRSIASY